MGAAARFARDRRADEHDLHLRRLAVFGTVDSGVLLQEAKNALLAQKWSLKIQKLYIEEFNPLDMYERSLGDGVVMHAVEWLIHCHSTPLKMPTL